jgi:glycosyltransferase involved in cell wall biosynthesis
MGAAPEGQRVTRRIVVLAPEAIRPGMAGMGIRALEIAAALAGRFDVRLLAPNDEVSSEAAARGVEGIPAPPGSPSFHREIRACDAALVSGHAASSVFVSAPHVPVAVDWYDPFLVENFHYRSTLGEEVEANDRRAWNLAIARGDFFLCASAEQRLFYAGMLLLAGRIDAASVESDPDARRLMAIVPFGASPPPPSDPEPVRRMLGAAPGDPVLFFGGLYDWHDPGPLLAIWPSLLEEFPGARIVFSENPNRETTPQRVFAEAVAESQRRGWKGRSWFFVPWTPYARRGALYGAASVAVCVCRPGLETELSFRTRLLDAAAAGLPSVSMNGGALAERLERAGAGIVAGSRDALRDGIARLLGDTALRRTFSEHARAASAELAWDRVVEPLAAFFDEPRISARLPFPEARPRAFRLLGRGRR